MKKQHIHIFLGILVLIAIAAAIFHFGINRKEVFTLGSNQFGMRFMKPEESKEDYLRSQMSICHANGSDACYKQVADLFNAQFDYKTLLGILERTQNFPEVFGRCHEMTHFIGRAAYKKNPDIRSLYQNGSPACWGAFYHGVIEAYFETKPYQGEEQFAADIRAVCGVQSDYSAPRFFSECLHGIGHAMMFVSNDDLPKSLAWCDALPTRQDQDTCYGGAFMENSSSSTRTGSGHSSKFLNESDPLYPCNILGERYLDICYRYQSSYFSQLVKYDWKKTGELCLSVPSDYQEGCFDTLGSNQVGSVQEPAEMNHTCTLMPNDFAEKHCIMGIMSGLIGRYINEPNIIEKFCTTVDKAYRKDCFIYFGKSLHSWSTDSEVVRFCDELKEATNASWCRDGFKSPGAPTFVN